MRSHILLAILPIMLSSCASTSDEFAVVDSNGDGYLGIDEARQLFPALDIRDVVMDGLLAKSEAQLALEGLVFPDSTGAEATQFIGPAEYVILAQQYTRFAADLATIHGRGHLIAEYTAVRLCLVRC